MSSSRPLCRLCERPTADGAVQAAHVDKEKLHTWFLNVCEHELADEIDDDDLICFFCIWHAEFLAKHVPGLDEMAWWPACLDYLDDAVKYLRMKYFEGKAEQCWVQLETIELPESDSEANAEPQASTSTHQVGKKCFYCGKHVKLVREHMRMEHKDAIRCDYKNCATYFHTVEEKEKHIEEVHEKSEERKMLNCMVCKKQFTYSSSYRYHVRTAHPDYSARCAFRGCLSYFNSNEELKSHIELTHKKEDEDKVFKCHFCEYKTDLKHLLSAHICRKHLAKTIKCEKCDKMFATKQLLSKHTKRYHTYWACTICSKDCVVQKRSIHLKRIKCKRCKNKFECNGLYQAHLKSCKVTLFKCDQCPKTFQFQSKLDYHMKRKHGSWRGLKYKKLGFKCEPCKRYYPSAKLLKQHLRTVHTKQGFKQCAHCPKSFPHFSYLINHLAEKHDLIERKHKCQECGRSYVSSIFLAQHKKSAHLVNSVSCNICGKSMMSRSLGRHMGDIHSIKKT